MPIVLNLRIIVLLTAILSFQAFSQDTSNCYPPCRTGYVCHNGECVSLCNPPCPSGQKCNQDGECIPVKNQTIQETSSTIEIERPKHIRRDIPCNEAFIVRPEMGPEVIPGDYEEGELINAANIVANAIVSSISSSTTIISNDEIDLVKQCDSKLIVVRVKSYYKEPARMGQYQGVVTIVIETYNSIKQERPTFINEFTAKGERHWGDSVPLENALQAVSKKIKEYYKL